MRLALATLALTLAVANGAAAAPQSLAVLHGEPGFALAGDAALLARSSHHQVKVERLPLDPAAPRSTLLRRHVRARQGQAIMSASSELAAVVVATENPANHRVWGQELAGPPAGPWAPLGPVRAMTRRQFAPLGHDVDGNTLLTIEYRNNFNAVRWVLREPGSPPRTIAAPRRAYWASIAGDVVAFATATGVAVRNWRTGAQLATYRLRGVISVDARADGAVVAGEIDGDAFELVPGAAPRHLTRVGSGAVYAGDRIVFVRRVGRAANEQLHVREPDGRVRLIGVPSGSITDFTADEERVLWFANDCLLTAPITEPAATAPDQGVCPRSELQLVDEVSPPVRRRDRLVRVRADCIAAPPPGCRGTLTIRAINRGLRAVTKRQRFAIPVGRRGRLNVRLTRRGYALVARADRRFGGAPVEVRTVTVDPDGRRRVQEHHLVLDVKR
jgi:hypothetical protein